MLLSYELFDVCVFCLEYLLAFVSVYLLEAVQIIYSAVDKFFIRAYLTLATRRLYEQQIIHWCSSDSCTAGTDLRKSCLHPLIPSQLQTVTHPKRIANVERGLKDGLATVIGAVFVAGLFEYSIKSIQLNWDRYFLCTPIN